MLLLATEHFCEMKIRESLPRALGTKAAARYIGMSEAYLLRARSTNGAEISAPQHVKIGNRIVYLIDDLDTWLDKCRSSTLNGGDV